MSEDVNLLVPADPRFRNVAPDVAGRYVVAVGGDEAQAAAVAERVGQAMDRVGNPNLEVAVDMRLRHGTAEVTVRCDGQSTTISVLTD